MYNIHEGWNQNQKTLFAITFIMTVLSTISFVLRLFARWRTATGLGYDDYCAFIGLVSSYGQNLSLLFAVVLYGYGRDGTDIGVENAQKTLIVGFVNQVAWQIAMPFIKFSILFFYDRVFHISKIQRISIFLGIFVLLWMITCTIVQIMACKPTRAFWEPTLPGSHCVDIDLFYTIKAALNTVTDAIVFGLPLPSVWNLMISRKKKIGLSLIFLLGGFSCIAGIVRMALLHSLNHDDPITAVNVGIWTSLEVSFGVISCNIPPAAPVFLKLVQSFRKKDRSSPLEGYIMSQRDRKRDGKRQWYGFSPEFSTIAHSTMHNYEAGDDTANLTMKDDHSLVANRDHDSRICG